MSGHRYSKHLDRWLAAPDDDPHHGLTEALHYVLNAAMYQSGEPFKADAVQRLTRLREDRTEILLARMVAEQHLMLVASTGKPQEKPTYVPYSRAKHLATRLPWRTAPLTTGLQQ